MHQEDSGNYATDAGNEPELSCFVKLTGFEQTDELRPATNLAQRRASPSDELRPATSFARRACDRCRRLQPPVGGLY